MGTDYNSSTSAQHTVLEQMTKPGKISKTFKQKPYSFSEWIKVTCDQCTSGFFPKQSER